MSMFRRRLLIGSNIKLIDNIRFNGWEYVDTEYVPSFYTGAECEFILEAYAERGVAGMCGFMGKGTYPRNGFGIDGVHKLYAGINNTIYTTNVLPGDTIKIQYRNNGANQITCNANINGIDYNPSPVNIVSSSDSMDIYYIGRRNDEYLYSKKGFICKLLNFILKEGEDIVRDYVPAILNGKEGLYDRTTYQFHEKKSII